MFSKRKYPRLVLVDTGLESGNHRTQQLESLIVIPFALIYVLGKINVFPLTVPYLFILAGIMLLVDNGLFFLAKSTFQRDEILTKWR